MSIYNLPCAFTSSRWWLCRSRSKLPRLDSIESDGILGYKWILRDCCYSSNSQRPWSHLGERVMIATYYSGDANRNRDVIVFSGIF